MAKITSEKVRIDYIYNAGDYFKRGKWDRGKLLEDARKVAKRTNQRLVRLEKAGLQNAPAYKGAEKALTGLYSRNGVPAWAGKGTKLRYQENMKQLQKLSNQELAAMLYSLGLTQKAKTSTPVGAREFSQKGLRSLAGIATGYDKLQTDDVLALFQDKAIQKANEEFGYKAVLQEINEIKAILIERNPNMKEENAQNIARGLFKSAKMTVARRYHGQYNLSDIQEQIDKILKRKRTKLDTSNFFRVD